MTNSLYAEACAATPAVQRFFQIAPEDFTDWNSFGEAIAANGVLKRVAENDFPMSRGERMLCLVMVGKADFGHIAAQAEPNVFGPGGFWCMDRVNGPIALKVIAEGLWD